MTDQLVFRALADISRRTLLDALFERDAQTLGELEPRFPDMTRFGVMKHLRVLEEAGLITRRRSGRATLHFLNPVPIRLIHDRWISKYAEPWAGALVDIKHALEGTTMTSDGARPQHVFEIYIKCTPQQLWEAITEARHTQRYFHGTSIESTWERGAPVVYRDQRGVAVQGQVREVTPPRRLVTTWEVKYDPERAEEQPSEVCWELEPVGDGDATTKLTLTHLFVEESKTYREVGSGWAAILSSLKTLLETGAPLSVAS